jgi:hypothetical protein
MGVTAGISILLKEMRYLVYIRYLCPPPHPDQPGVRLCRGKLPAALSSRLFTTLNWGKWGDKFGFVILHLGYTSHNRRVHSGRVDIAQLILDVVSPNFQ